MAALRFCVCLFLILGLGSSIDAQTDQREWTGTHGHYTFTGRMLATSESQVVVLQDDGQLVRVALSDLSEDDQAYVKSKEAQDAMNASDDGMRPWNMKSGLKVNGRVVDFAQEEVKIERNLGRIEVNGQRFDELPGVYQAIVPKVVGHFEGAELETKRDLMSWMNRQAGGARSRSYKVDGVLLELEGGERYAVPLFLFSAGDESTLKPAWERWAAAHVTNDEPAKEEESMNLRAQSQSMANNPDMAENQQLALDMQRNQQLGQIAQIQQLQLQTQAYNAGLFDLWKVNMAPPNGDWSMQQQVVVPGRNSDEASNTAMQQHPGWRITGVAKARRRGR